MAEKISLLRESIKNCNETTVGKELRNINWTKKSGILIIAICLIAILLGYLVEPYRGTWIYSYGNMVSLLLFNIGVLGSLGNTIHLISKYKSNYKDNLIWLFLSAIPFLYFGIMMTIAMTRISG